MNIVDHLYLGSAAHAGQLELLERLGITALLNVSPNCPNHWPDKFEYSTIPVEDNSTADIKVHFGAAIDFINGVKSRGGKVLVHCKAGVSRSATLCLAYLISCRKMCLNDAYDQVKVPCIHPGVNSCSKCRKIPAADLLQLLITNIQIEVCCITVFSA